MVIIPFHKKNWVKICIILELREKLEGISETNPSEFAEETDLDSMGTQSPNQ